MNYEEHKKEKWMKENSPKSQLLANNILPMNPEVGFYITVEGLQISQDFFTEEYEQISKSYYSVMKKLDEYYKTQNIQSFCECGSQKDIDCEYCIGCNKFHSI